MIVKKQPNRIKHWQTKLAVLIGLSLPLAAAAIWTTDPEDEKCPDHYGEGTVQVGDNYCICKEPNPIFPPGRSVGSFDREDCAYYEQSYGYDCTYGNRAGDINQACEAAKAIATHAAASQACDGTCKTAANQEKRCNFDRLAPVKLEETHGDSTTGICTTKTTVRCSCPTE